MYSFESRVRYSECDERLRLSIPATINYLQDCSMFHCEHIGHGQAYCAEHHFAWFVAAWQIRLLQLPTFCDYIRVSTWCNQMGNTLATRHFLMQAENGKHLVEAESLCVTVNTQTGKAQRIPAEEQAFLTDEPSLGLPPTRRKLRLGGEGREAFSVEVGRQLLDSNGHVNNVQYIALAEDAIRMQDANFRAGTILVQYKLAAHLGDTMRMLVHEETDGYGVDLANVDGGSFAIVRMLRAE